jgi:hypothetical protein
MPLLEDGVKHRAIRFSFLLLAASVITLTAVAASKNTKAQGETTLVDSGTFSIFQSGRRLATETFRVQQGSDYSITTSDLKLEDGSTQSSELQLWSNGNLRKYVWRAVHPEKAESTIEPGDQVLIQHITSGSGKPLELPYLLPTSTIVLDDYVFVHRELLAWRYLASGCIQGLSKCQLAKAQLGVLVPRQHTPATVSMEYVGPEKVSIRGTEQELNRFNLKSDDVEWQLWLDSRHRLVRILIASEHAEVLRD